MHLLLEPSFSALRRVQPFAAAPRPLGARHAAARSRCALLARRVQQAERDVEAPPAPPSPQSPEHATPAAAPAPTAEHAQHDAATPSSAAADAQPPSHGPRLPPRPARQQQKQPSPEPRRPFPFQRPGAAAILATYGAYIGAVGTLAVGTAWLTDVHLASMFRWSPDVVQSALLAFAPLAAFNTLIMLPDYSTWALPKLDGKDPEGEAVIMQSQGIAGAAKGKQQDGAAAAAAEAGQQGRAADAAAGSDIAAASTTVASSAAAAEGASTSNSGAGSADAQPSPSQHVAKVPASAWGQKKPPMRILKDAMHLAQGHYTANNPTIDLNPAFEVVTTTAQALAGEMLYRGVAITLLTQWLADRFYEAGADDMVTLPLSSTLMDTHEAAQWTAAWLLVAVSFGLALRKVYAAPRPRVVSMIDLRQAARKQGGGSAPSDAPASASDGTPSPAPGVRDAEGPLKPRAPQPGWMPQGFQQVTTLAAAIQGARNCSQTLIFNCLFVATGGNLAATFTASLANQLLFSALQRSSMERMQKRSASLAKELEALNRRLMEIQRKKTARASAAAAAAVAEVEADPGVRMARRGAVEEAGEAGSAGTEQGSEVSVLSASAANEQRREEAAAAGPSVSAAAEEHLAVTAAVAAAAQPQQGQALLHAAANAAANAAADLSGEAASVQPAVAAAAAGGGGGDSSGRAPDQLTRALMALELLLPAEPTAASPSKGQAK